MPIVKEESHHNHLEIKFIQIIQQSKYADISKIYKNFYAQSDNPEKILRLLVNRSELDLTRVKNIL